MIAMLADIIIPDRNNLSLFFFRKLMKMTMLPVFELSRNSIAPVVKRQLPTVKLVEMR